MSEEEFFISFDTLANPGKLEAVRVRLDNVTIADMNKKMNIGLVDHPLYAELEQYVLANPLHGGKRANPKR